MTSYSRTSETIRVIAGGLGIMTLALGFLFCVAPPSHFVRQYFWAFLLVGSIVILASKIGPIIYEANRETRKILASGGSIGSVLWMSIIGFVAMVFSGVVVFVAPLVSLEALSSEDIYWFGIGMFVIASLFGTALRVRELAEIRKFRIRPQA